MKALFSFVFLCAIALPVSAGQRCQDNILETTPTERFIASGPGVVTDTQTGLMWRTCIEGIGGSDCTSGNALLLTWAGALTYVSEINANGGAAGYKDWRLPNIRELSSLIDLQCVNPALNTSVFPNSPGAQVWTSSPYHFYTHYSWYVDFSNGAPTYDERIAPKSLRLVRNAE